MEVEENILDYFDIASTSYFTYITLVFQQKKSVLVLGGRERHALAIVRSLGSRGIPVFAADSYRNCTSALSKYCVGQFVYPCPENNPEAFIGAIEKIIREQEFEMVFAVTDIIPILLTKHKNNLSKYSKILVPDLPIFEQANNKENTFQIAITARIPSPKTYTIRNYDDIEIISPHFQYPAILKPTSKTNIASGKSIVQKAIFITSEKELKQKFHEAHQATLQTTPFLLQEYIPGNGGYGVGLLCNQGNTLASFAFQRLHEYPISGGASTLRIGIDHPEMVDLAKRLMNAMNWTGVAMVEFKIDNRDKVPKLIEVNGRFWGSLALAIYSGVDFPYLLYKFSRGEELPEVYPQFGIKARWLIPGDIMYLVESLRIRKNRIATLINFFQNFWVKDDVLSTTDPLPLLGELKISFIYFWEVLLGKRSIHGELKKNPR